MEKNWIGTGYVVDWTSMAPTKKIGTSASGLLLLGLLVFSGATMQAETELIWNSTAEDAWSSEGVWKNSSGSEASWEKGAVARFPSSKSTEIFVDIPSEVVAESVRSEKSPLHLSGTGPLVLSCDSTAKSIHVLAMPMGITLDVPVSLDGGGLQAWVAGSAEQPFTVNKGISERSPTGISFNFGTLALESPSTFSGGIALNNAALALGHDEGAGTGPIVMGSQKNIISVVNGSRSIKNTITTPFISGIVPWQFEGNGNLTVTAPVTFQGSEKGGVAISIASGMVVTFAEGILAAEGRENILQSLTLTGGSGTLVLQKEVAYTGKTAIEAGRLVMNGYSEKQKSWTLSGTGILSGAGTIALDTDEDFFFAAGKISPGMDDQVGTLKILGSMKVGKGFEYVWTFGARVPEGDVLDLGGSFLPESAWGPWKVVVRPAAGTTLPPGNYRWPIIKSQAAIPAEAVAQALVEIDTKLGAERFTAKLEPSATGIDLVMTVK